MCIACTRLLSHVFYLLCKASAEVRAPGRLSSWESYAILKQEGTIERVTSWNDAAQFEAMHEALQELGFNSGQRTSFYTMLAIVLHLGNVAFDSKEMPDGSDGASPADEAQLALVVDLLQVCRRVSTSA